MQTITVPIRTLGFAISTRVALGVGIGLLLGDCLTAQRRRGAGLALLALGGATTVPVVRALRRGFNRFTRNVPHAIAMEIEMTPDYGERELVVDSR